MQIFILGRRGHFWGSCKVVFTSFWYVSTVELARQVKGDKYGNNNFKQNNQLAKMVHLLIMENVLSIDHFKMLTDPFAFIDLVQIEIHF